MLQASLLMFSRSFSIDYRWVYCAPGITHTDKSELMGEYRAFELNRNYYLGEPHCVLHRTEDGIAVFRFSKTSQTDNCSRPIFAMTGVVFSGLDAKVLLALPTVILSSLFCSDILEFDHWEVSDSLENAVRAVEFSLDHMLDEYRNNLELQQFAVRLKGIEKRLADTSVLITCETVSPMKSETRNAPAKTQYSADIDALLNSYGSYGKNDSSSSHNHDYESYDEKRGASFLGKALDAVVGWFSDRDD